MGLLSKDNVEQTAFAYNVYKTRDDKSEELATRFKKAFGRDVTIDFLGVWFVPIPITRVYRPCVIVRFAFDRDTVASVGHFHSPTLPFVGSNDMIKVFRHALALDEVRMIFKNTRVKHGAIQTPL